MKINLELAHLYRTELVRDLARLEKTRIQLVNKIILNILIGLPFWGLAIFSLFYYVSEGFELFTESIFVLTSLFISAIYYLAKKPLQEYRARYKEKIIRKIIAHVDNTLIYKPNDHIAQDVFVHSDITGIPNIYSGDDYVEGKIGETTIQFSELHAQRESGSGKNRRVTTLFKGLFFCIDFNKHFNSKTFVLTDEAEKTFGSFGTKLQKFNTSKGKLVKLEDIEFEKEFVVYSNNENEARYILSPSFMQRLSAFKHKTGNNIQLSFIENNFYLTIPYKKKLFEPKLFKNIQNMQQIEEYYQDIKLALDVVEDLNLNTRIWSKS